MTVSSSYTDKVYAINGTTKVFPWGQDLDTQYGSLVVTEETAASGGEIVTTYVEGTDYEIIDKNVWFNTAPSDTTHFIHITRDTYKGQPVEFIEGENFPANDYEASLDRLAMAIQELVKWLNDEKTARVNADTELDTAITTESNRAKGVEGTLSNLTTTDKSSLVAAINEVVSAAGTIATGLSSHTSNTSNPHSVTKTQVGLGNVDNTSDLDKPISTATQTALDAKANSSSIGNATLTIKQGGVSKGTFTANASTDAEIDLDASGKDIVFIRTARAVFNENAGGGTIDVSESVEAGVLYYPFVATSSSNIKILGNTAQYSKNNKYISMTRDTDLDATATQYGVSVILIPTDSTSSSALGMCNGQYVATSNSRYYSKAEIDATVGDIETILNDINSGGE